MTVILFKQEIKLTFLQWLITGTFHNYFYIDILLNLNRRFRENNDSRALTCMHYAHIILHAVDHHVLKAQTVGFPTKQSFYVLHVRVCVVF